MDKACPVLTTVALSALVLLLLVCVLQLASMMRREHLSRGPGHGTTGARMSLGARTYAKELASAVNGFPAPDRPSMPIADELGRVLHLAHAAFASDEAVRAWLGRPNPGLGGMPPILAATEQGGAERLRKLVEAGAGGKGVAGHHPETPV